MTRQQDLLIAAQATARRRQRLYGQTLLLIVLVAGAALTILDAVTTGGALRWALGTALAAYAFHYVREYRRVRRAGRSLSPDQRPWRWSPPTPAAKRTIRRLLRAIAAAVVTSVTFMLAVLLGAPIWLIAVLGALGVVALLMSSLLAVWLVWQWSDWLSE